ncbi:MAG: formylglycine-generating enzyme family protein [Planctomycetia bacterium]|nr:formylglycine-generating enzyme family protein [Planctomycetia bacterium]
MTLRNNLSRAAILTSVLSLFLASTSVTSSCTAHDVAATQQTAQTRAAGTSLTLTLKGIELSFHWAPAGVFVMGSPENEPGRYDDEVQHEVTLTHGFWLAETETTQRLWDAFMPENPSGVTDDPQLPVERVSWDDCVAFIEKLNAECADVLPQGYRFALPTEAQWEYACRAGNYAPFNFVEANDLAKAMEQEVSDPYEVVLQGINRSELQPVRTNSKPNAWGLYDMHGNVYEWTDDVYDYRYYLRDDATLDPKGSDVGKNRVLRGGSWLYGVAFCRAAARARNVPATRGYNYGFRLALRAVED